MDVMDLTAKIFCDAQDFEKGLDSASSSFSSFGNSLKSGASAVGKVAVGAVVAVGTAVAGATTAFVAGAKEVGAYADDISKSSQKLGMSAESYQEWSFIMEHSGSSIDAVKGAMVKLNKAVEAGGEAFDQLGLSQEAMMSMGAEEQWETAVKALQGVEDETERARLAQELFGKSYQELMPLLNSGADSVDEMKQQVHDLGGVMSDEAVEAGANFQDSLLNMQTALSGLKNNMMGEFLPSMSTVMDGLASVFSGDSGGIAKIKEGIEGLAGKLNEVLPQAIETLSGIAESLLASLPAFADTIAQQLPTILTSLIPILVNTLVSLSDTIVGVLPKIVDAIKSNISVITRGLSQIIMSIGKIILQLFPVVFPMLIQVGLELVQELSKGIVENIDLIIQSIIEVVNVIITELTNPDTLMMLLQCGLQILTAVIEGIANNLDLILQCIGTLLLNVGTFLVEAIPEIVTSIGKNGATIVTDVLPHLITSIGEAGAELLLNVSSILSGWIPDIVDGAKEAFESIGKGIMDAWDWIKGKISDLGTKALQTLEATFSLIFNIGKNLVQGLWNGINDAKDWVLEKIKGFGTGILDGIKDFFGISSPSKKTAVFGRFLAEGLAVGVEDEAPSAFADIEDAMNKGIDGLELNDLELGASASVKVRASGSKGNSTEASLESIYKLLEYIAKTGMNFTLPVYFGTQQFDEMTYNSRERLQKRSGGQVDG